MKRVATLVLHARPCCVVKGCRSKYAQLAERDVTKKGDMVWLCELHWEALTRWG